MNEERLQILEMLATGKIDDEGFYVSISVDSNMEMGRRISEDTLIRQRARIRPIASPEGASCVERLMEPYPSMLERQLARMHETRTK